MDPPLFFSVFLDAFSQGLTHLHEPLCLLVGWSLGLPPRNLTLQRDFFSKRKKTCHDKALDFSIIIVVISN